MFLFKQDCSEQAKKANTTSFSTCVAFNVSHESSFCSPSAWHGGSPFYGEGQYMKPKSIRLADLCHGNMLLLFECE